MPLVFSRHLRKARLFSKLLCEGLGFTFNLLTFLEFALQKPTRSACPLGHFGPHEVGALIWGVAEVLRVNPPPTPSAHAGNILAELGGELALGEVRGCSKR